MFGSGVLELAIGLSVVFLVFSTVCSGVREFIARVFMQREKMLTRGVYRFLGSVPPTSGPTRVTPASAPASPPAPASASGSAPASARAPIAAVDPAAHAGIIQPQLAALVLGHPLITNLASKAESSPSYIPSRTFALALLDVLMPAEQGPRTVAGIRRVVEQLDNASVRNALLPIVDAAGDDMHKLQMAVEHRFDDTMDRVSGWYKRHSQVLIFYIALGVAAAFNVDTLHVSRALWSEPTLRSRIAHEGTAAVQAQPAPSDGSPTAAVLKNVSDQVTADAPMPVGWDFVTSEAKEKEPAAWFWRILGWLLTALALSLGAPFWFDILSQLVNVRSSGPPPPKADDAPAPTATK